MPKKTNKSSDVLSLYLKGLGYQEIAESLKISIFTVEKYLSNFRKDGTINKKNIDNDELIKMYQNGYSRKQIADRFNVSIIVIESKIAYLRSKGIEISKKENELTALFKKQIDFIKQLNIEGYKTTTILNKIGVEITKKNLDAYYKFKNRNL